MLFKEMSEQAAEDDQVALRELRNQNQEYSFSQNHEMTTPKINESQDNLLSVTPTKRALIGKSKTVEIKNKI